MVASTCEFRAIDCLLAIFDGLLCWQACEGPDTKRASRHDKTSTWCFVKPPKCTPKAQKTSRKFLAVYCLSGPFFGSKNTVNRRFLQISRKCPLTDLLGS